MRIIILTGKILLRLGAAAARGAMRLYSYLRLHFSARTVVGVALLIVGLIVFQVHIAVRLTQNAVVHTGSAANHKVAKSFAERMSQVSHNGSDAEVLSALNEISRLNPAVRAYIIDERGIVDYSPRPYGKVRLPFVDMQPVRDFLTTRPEAGEIQGDDPHNLGSVAPISVARLTLKGEPHYLYVVLAAATTAHAGLLSAIGTGFGVLLVSVLSMGLLVFVLLFIAHRRVQGLQSSVAALSHDLRAPLSSVQGYLETLLTRGERINPEDSQRYMSVALRSTRSAANMVNDLHQLSVLEASGNPVEMEPLSLVDLVMDTLMAAKPIADEKRISLAWDVPPNVPLAFGNIPLLERLARNLIENAIRYTPARGRIEVTFSVLPDSIRITVSDSGVGIPESELGKVSQSYFRGSKTKSSTKGSGIGLAICAKIAKLHGRELRILSREREGTAVMFEVAQAEQAYH